MTKKSRTPGVYIEEVNAFPGLVVEVATAIPAFIGYTEKAAVHGKSLLHQPVRITSLQEFHELFGMRFDTKFELTLITSEEDNIPVDPKSVGGKHHMELGSNVLKIDIKEEYDLIFYNSLSLFYRNGGSTCYIVSVGLFDEKDGIKIDAQELISGLELLKKEQEPTMIIIPEAVKVGEKCYDVYKQVLAHCKNMQSRVAILDVYNGDEAVFKDSVDETVNTFRRSIGRDYLDYAAAYHPWLHTTIVSDGDISFLNFADEEEKAIAKLKELVTEKEAIEIMQSFPATQADLETLFQKDHPYLKENEKEAALIAYKKNTAQMLHQGLWATSPTYKNILSKLKEILNLLPPSAAMAGIYTAVDNNRGVWKSPANVSLSGVIKPSTMISNEEQEGLNVDAMGGKSINAIRTFPGIGTLVWGGRTLDGNSLDWRYINIRRTMIMLEQSIKLALIAYVFEPNDANTWVTVKSMIVNFLTDKWKQGALAGSSPEDAFDVQIGLGSTMTGVDILEGRMLLSIKLAIVRPAEFIVVTFEQQMQKA